MIELSCRESGMGQTPLRVLVTDDCRDSAESLALLIELWGHQARVACDGADALESARTYQPDVVLLDIEMPRMSGYEVARRLRQQTGTADAILVALSGHGSENDQGLSAQAGIQFHLVKPFDPEQLRQLLGRSAALRAETRQSREEARSLREEAQGLIDTAQGLIDEIQRLGGHSRGESSAAVAEQLK